MSHAAAWQAPGATIARAQTRVNGGASSSARGKDHLGSDGRVARAASRQRAPHRRVLLNRIAALGGKYDSNDANGAETPPGPTPAPAPRAAIPPRSRSPLRRPPSAGAEVYTTEIETARAADLDDSTIAEARETLRMVSHANAERAASSAGAMTKSAPPGKRDHHRAMIVEGVRQGWPLAKLLESTPPLPHSTDINLSNCKAHLALYDVLLDAGRLHNALELLRAMKAAGLNTVGGRISHKAFMREAAKKRAVAVAFDFVTFVDYPDVRLYNMLLSVCAAAGDARSGFAAFVLMYDAGVRPDCKAYTTLISACAKAGDVEKAFETFRRMKEDGVAPTVVTYGALMDALSRRVKELTHGQSSSSGANAGAAATTTAKAKHCDVDNTNGCADDVESLLDRCFELKADMLDDGIVPDACVLNSLLSACGRAAVVKPLASEALRRAFEVYDEFEASAGVLRCDAYTYASLIQACANAGEPERGLALYERMAGEKVRRTKEVYAAAIHACAGSRRAASGGRAADLRRALRVWDDMRRSADRTTPDAMLYATLMDVAARAGERGVAAEVMDEMERDGVAPTTEVFATMAGIAAREGDVAGVEKVLDEMTERGSPPPISAFNALIAAAARRGDVAAATDACERLAAAGLSKDVNTHENLIRTAAHARDASAAWAFYDDALAAEMEPTRPMFNALVYASGRGGDLKRTFEAVDAMKARGHVPDETTWRELLSSCARHGDAALAWDTYKASRKAGTEPSEVALNIIIGVTLMKIRELTDPTRGGGAKEGDREWKEWADRAVAVYHEATVAGVRPRLATFSAMLACLRPPTIPALQAVDRDAGSGSAAAALAHAVSHEDTSHEDARKYYPLRALILYEEAQALGVVPKFHMDRDETYDIREFPPAAAEVAVLTLLRVFRRNSDAAAGDVDLPNVTLRVLSDEEHEEMSASGDQHDQRLARTGDRVVVLLRRLRFNYGGSLSRGRVELSGNVIKRWLKAKPSPSPSSHRGEGALPGTEPRLASSLQDQARNIRAMSYDERDDPRDGGDDPYGGGAAWNTNTLGGAPGGANRPRLGGVAGTGRGLRRGLGQGSDIDFFGAADGRYGGDGDGAAPRYKYKGRRSGGSGSGNAWGSADVDDCMMNELSRIIREGPGSGESESDSWDDFVGESDSDDAEDYPDAH